MKSFFSYLKSKLMTLAAAATCTVIFCVTLNLYGTPVKAMIYPLCVCMFIMAMFLMFGWLGMRKKCIEIAKMRSMTAEMISSFPAAGTPCEEEYAKLCEYLKNTVISDKEIADASYREMIDYYTVWAHQIKTPISSMKLAIQSEDSELARKLSADLFKTQQYVDMVMAYLRLGSESSDFVFREHDIDVIIRNSVKNFAPEFIGRKLSLNYEEVNMKFVTDEKWLSFVIGQILSNALKYTAEGGISVYPCGKDTICFEDTGIGIAPEDLPRVFEKGYTGNNGRIETGASGLGLYLCRRICGKLDIRISIESQPGKGTKVYLCKK